MKKQERAHLIKTLSKELLKENKVEKIESLEKNGIRLTNFYSDNIIPIGMLTEEQKELVKSYFKNKINDYYYVEII
jgi:hypothetical protein